MDPNTRCYVCDRRVGSRGELDHFPTPKSLGGEETEPICLPCHDLKDRIGVRRWNPSTAFASMSGLWTKASPDERLMLAKIFHVYSQGLVTVARRNEKRKEAKRAAIEDSLAMAYKAERGEYTGVEPPYGWRVSADGVVIEADEREQQVIAEACELRAAGLSLLEVGAELAVCGLLHRSGGRWNAVTVSALLSANDKLSKKSARSTPQLGLFS